MGPTVCETLGGKPASLPGSGFRICTMRAVLLGSEGVMVKCLAGCQVCWKGYLQTHSREDTEETQLGTVILLPRFGHSQPEASSGCSERMSSGLAGRVLSHSGLCHQLAMTLVKTLPVSGPRSLCMKTGYMMYEDWLFAY